MPGVPQRRRRFAFGVILKSLSSSRHKQKLNIWHLLRPHRSMLALAFIAVLGEAATDLLEPWPLKIVFDYVFGTKHIPAWLSGLLGATFGLGKVAILHFAILAVIVIAVAGACGDVLSQLALYVDRAFSNTIPVCCRLHLHTSHQASLA
jgi:ABC-type multidrug transport system fused ATPase/permease subunit